MKDPAPYIFQGWEAGLRISTFRSFTVDNDADLDRRPTYHSDPMNVTKRRAASATLIRR